MLNPQNGPAAGTEEIRLSVVIRCDEQQAQLPWVLEALQAQQCSFAWDAIVVRDASAAQLASVCQQYGAGELLVDWRQCTEGRALNLAIGQARGELILVLAAHALPVGVHFLEDAAAPFADPAMAAARCLRVGDDEQVGAWHRAVDLQYQSPPQQRAAESAPDWDRKYPSSDCFVLRRAAWEQVSFDECLVCGCDKLWTSQVLARKWKKPLLRAEALWLVTRKTTDAEWRQIRSPPSAQCLPD